MIEPNYLPFILIGGGIIFVILFFHYVPFFLWLSAKVSGVRISLIQLFLMRIRNVPPYVIVPAMIEAHKAGLSTITRDELEAHYMAGGHVEKVVHALVSASKANIELSFQMATGIDLAGRDVFEAVQMSVNPKVIDTPPVTAVAKDGIQLIAKARVTVRANIRQLVGGAGEDTILARVGEGIVSSIGSSENHKSVLENPDSISKLVLRKGLDAGTAFEILSIDIADIDIGRNIGAALQIDQANADKNIAQAKAEERRAMAVALEQEMKAKAEETELWPNLIAALHKRKIPLVIANARLSARSAAGYAKLGKFVRRLLRRITLIAAQNEEDGARFVALGAKNNQVTVTGSLKFDISVTPQLAAKAVTLRRQWAPHRPVWIATSTHEGEESVVIAAHQALLQQFPNLLLILVPHFALSPQHQTR